MAEGKTDFGPIREHYPSSRAEGLPSAASAVLPTRTGERNRFRLPNLLQRRGSGTQPAAPEPPNYNYREESTAPVLPAQERVPVQEPQPARRGGRIAGAVGGAARGVARGAVNKASEIGDGILTGSRQKKEQKAREKAGSFEHNGIPVAGEEIIDRAMEIAKKKGFPKTDEKKQATIASVLKQLRAERKIEVDSAEEAALELALEDYYQTIEGRLKPGNLIEDVLLTHHIGSEFIKKGGFFGTLMEALAPTTTARMLVVAPAVFFGFAGTGVYVAFSLATYLYAKVREKIVTRDTSVGGDFIYWFLAAAAIYAALNGPIKGPTIDFGPINFGTPPEIDSAVYALYGNPTQKQKDYLKEIWRYTDKEIEDLLKATDDQKKKAIENKRDQIKKNGGQIPTLDEFLQRTPTPTPKAEGFPPEQQRRQAYARGYRLDQRQATRGYHGQG